MTPQADPGARLAEEIRLLLAAVAEHAAPWLERVAASTHREHSAEDTPSSCGWCPLCALITFVRGEPAELVGRALDRAADLVALLRAVLADRWEPDVVHMPGFRPTEPDQSRPRPVVQKIPVRRGGNR